MRESGRKAREQRVLEYIRTATAIGRQGGKVWIYGSGSRGLQLYQDIVRNRPDLVVAGFLDLNKAGTFQSLPLVPIATYFAGRHAAVDPTEHVVVASAYHDEIANSLRAKGLLHFSICLEPDEDMPLVATPTEEVIGRLTACRHPLPIATDSRETGDGIYYTCPKFSTLYMRPTGLSFCCWIPDLADAMEPRSALDRIASLSCKFIEHASDGKNSFCMSCPDLKVATEKQEIIKFTNVDIDVSVTCNVKCRYCRVDKVYKHVCYDYSALLSDAIANGYFEEKFTFTWGGFGEPVLNRQFTALLGKLLSLGATGQIYTNATIHSPLIEEGIRSGQVLIMPSVDAGTAAGYARMKGVDKLETVWRNTKAGPQKVYVKYVVTDANCTPEEIARFIERCGEAGVRNLAISKDFYEEVLDPKVFDAVVDLARRARANAMRFFMLPAAFPQAAIEQVAAIVESA